MDFRPNRLVRVLALNLQRHRQLLPSRKARGKRDCHRRLPRRAVVGQRHDSARPGNRPFRHINDNSAATHEPRRGLGRAAHERGDGRSRRHRDDDAAAQRVVERRRRRDGRVVTCSGRDADGRGAAAPRRERRKAFERRIGRAGSGVAISERTGTAAVGDSGKASMSVASTGLVERGGVLGGVKLHIGDRISGRDDVASTAGALGPKLVRARATGQEK